MLKIISDNIISIKDLSKRWYCQEETCKSILADKCAIVFRVITKRLGPNDKIAYEIEYLQFFAPYYCGNQCPFYGLEEGDGSILKKEDANIYITEDTSINIERIVPELTYFPIQESPLHSVNLPLQNDTQERNESLSQLNAEIGRLKDKLDTSENFIKEIMFIKEDLESQLAELQKENDALKEKLVTYDNEVQGNARTDKANLARVKKDLESWKAALSAMLEVYRQCLLDGEKERTEDQIEKMFIKNGFEIGGTMLKAFKKAIDQAYVKTTPGASRQ